MEENRSLDSSVEKLNPEQLPQPKPPKSFFKNKLIILGLFILLIFSAKGIYMHFLTRYYNLPKPTIQYNSSLLQFTPVQTVDETANWKTYTNTKVGYSIRYPSSFSNPTVSGANIETEANGTESDVNFTQQNQGLSFFLETRPYSKSLAELYEEHKSTVIYQGAPGSLKSSIRLLKKINIDGIQADWYVESVDDGKGNIQDDNHTVLFVAKNHSFKLSTMPYINNFSSEDIQLIEQILSTFKFTQ